jgi:hypothetical protein
MSKLPTVNKLPAVKVAVLAAPSAILNPEEYLAFEDMVGNIENIVIWSNDVIDLLSGASSPTAEWLKEAQSELAHCEDEKSIEWLADCARQLQRFDPKSAYDNNGRITMAQASVHIAALVDGFPTKNTPANFVNRLLMEVMAARPSVIELESACRQLLRSEKDFAPGVGKVVAAIKEQMQLWSIRTMAVRTFRDEVGLLREAIAIGGARLAAKKAKADADAYAEQMRIDAEVRARPLTVGDRVRHTVGGGVGTVVGDDVPGRVNYCSLRSDKGGRVIEVDRQFLEKLALA